MAYDGVVKDFQAIRRMALPKRVPCVAISEEFDVRWHGRYSYEEFCQDGDKIFEVYRAAIEHFDYDWALVQIDDCFEFEPIGVGVKGEGSIVRGTCRRNLPGCWSVWSSQKWSEAASTYDWRGGRS